MTSKGLRALAMLLIAFALLPTTAHAVFERVGPVSAVNGYPIWYQDKTGITLELCTPTTAAELAGGYCLLLPGDTTAPEVFPTSWFDEHFYWDASTVVDMPLAPGATKAGRAVLVQALEGAFATGPVIPGEQIVFGRFRFDFRDLPLSGTYTIYTPFGIRVFANQVGGVGTRLFYTEDIGLSCPLGDFTCALQAGVGPFLLPSNTAGGAELPPFTDPAIPGMKYIADPARTGPVTGSVLPPYVTPLGTFNANRFRIEVTDGLGNTTAIVDTEDFGLQGRLYQQAIPSRVTIDRASYARSVANNISVDVYATGEPTVQPRLPGAAVVPAAYPDLRLFDAPCGGTLATDGVTILPPFTAPAGGVSIPMPRFGTSFYGHTTPVAIPAGVCVVDMNAKDANGNLVPHYDPAPLGDQVFISEAFYDPTSSTLAVYGSSSDLLSPPQLSVGAFGDMVANEPLVDGLALLAPIAAPPSKVRVLSQEGGSAELQVTVGRRPASGVTLSANLLSPQVQGAPLVLTAAGQGSAGYMYRFFRSVDGAGTWQMVQDWSTTATYAVPANTAPVALQFYVEVKTTNLVVRDAVSSILHFTLLPAPATGVTVTPSQTSPQLTGVAIDFVAQGQGSTGYSYRFFRSSNGGGTWTMVRDWSTNPIYQLPGTTASGTYLVYAEVRTTTLVLRDVGSPGTELEFAL